MYKNKVLPDRTEPFLHRLLPSLELISLQISLNLIPFHQKHSQIIRNLVA